MATSHRKATGEGVTILMKYPSRKVFFRFVQFAILAASVFSGRALAQAEIDPDHFDSTPSAAATKTSTGAAATTKSTSTGLSAKKAPQAGQAAMAQGTGNASATDKSGRGRQHSNSAKSASAQPPKSKKSSSTERVASARPQ
jgi:hypothetical protein